jgi:leader peptidase (prepilin peptidase)/N-methyltransferase
VLEWGFEIFVAAWLFALGAAVGSFLNVVVYRLPRRMNLMHPPSHCPRCRTAIRPLDNIPIVSWLWLGGRCRVCRLPIPPRYFRVELLVALLFLGLALAEMHAPWRQAMRNIPRVAAPLERSAGLPFWFAYATHAALAVTLLAAAQIDRAGFRTPKRLFAPAILLGLVTAAIWPRSVRLAAWESLPLAGWQAGLATAVAGLAFGALVGLLVGFWWRVGARSAGWPRFAPAMMLATVGLVLGWQRTSLLAVGVLAALLPLALAIKRSGGRLYFAPAALVLLFTLPCLVGLDFTWPEWTKVVAGRPWGLIVVTLITVELLALAAGALAPETYLQETAPPDEPVVELAAEAAAPASEKPSAAPEAPGDV